MTPNLVQVPAGNSPGLTDCIPTESILTGVESGCKFKGGLFQISFE